MRFQLSLLVLMCLLFCHPLAAREHVISSIPSQVLQDIQEEQTDNTLFAIKEDTHHRVYFVRFRAPLWMTGWLLFLTAVMIVSACYLLVHRRVKAVREQARIKATLNDYREKALRLQMNPHFIYNSMNSIQNYIRKNEAEASISFLSKFSALMRMSFHNAGVDLITLDQDLEALKVYAEMENLRFPGKFRLDIVIDPCLHPDEVYIPPLLIQPFVENAILHGFIHQQIQGQIHIDIRREAGKLCLSIRDNGIGIHQALLIRQKKDQYLPSAARRTSGTNITVARIRQVWGNILFPNMFLAKDLSTINTEETGTLIRFYLPLKYDQNHSC